MYLASYVGSNVLAFNNPYKCLIGLLLSSWEKNSYSRVKTSHLRDQVTRQVVKKLIHIIELLYLEVKAKNEMSAPEILV